MTLTINSPTNTLITISSTLLDDFIATPADYTSLTIVGYFNDTTTGITEIYTEADPITTITNVASNAGVETILPSFFSATEFAQGVYQFTITLIGDEIEVDEGCIYVEDGLKCDIDDYLLATGTELNDKLFVGIQYQSLLNATVCACKCDNLIEIYNYLIKQIDTSVCKTC